jgi:hypothetical protein
VRQLARSFYLCRSLIENGASNVAIKRKCPDLTDHQVDGLLDVTTNSSRVFADDSHVITTGDCDRVSIVRSESTCPSLV